MGSLASKHAFLTYKPSAPQIKDVIFFLSAKKGKFSLLKLMNILLLVQIQEDFLM